MGWLMRLVFGISAASGVAFGGVPFGYRSSPLHVEGQKVMAPHFQRSEAGISWSLGGGLALQLHYERSAYAPMMHQDHDDGILTRLKLSF